MPKIIIKSNRLGELSSGQIRGALAGVIARGAVALEAAEKELVREKDIIDTGFLLNSIAAEQVNALNWVVGNGAEYSADQNYGTVHQPARPFVEPAVDIVKPQIEADAKRALDNV